MKSASFSRAAPRLEGLAAPADSPETPVWIFWNDARVAVWLIFPRQSLRPARRAAWKAPRLHLRLLAWRARVGAAFDAGSTIPDSDGSGPIPRQERFVR